MAETDLVFRLLYVLLIFISCFLYFGASLSGSRKRNLKNDTHVLWYVLLLGTAGIALSLLLIEQILLEISFPLSEYPLGPLPDLENQIIAQFARVIVSLAIFFSAIAVLASNMFILYFLGSKFLKIGYFVALWEIFYVYFYFTLPYIWIRQPDVWQYAHPGFHSFTLILFLIPVYTSVLFFVMLFFRVVRREGVHSEKLQHTLLFTIANIILASGYTIQVLSPSLLSAFCIFLFPILMYRTFSLPGVFDEYKLGVMAFMETPIGEKEDILRVISEQSLLGIAIIQDNRLKYVNESIARINGYSIDEMMSWNFPDDFTDRIHPEDLEFAADQARKKQLGEEDGIITNYSYRLMTKDGDIRWVDQYSKTIVFGGKPADFITLIDSTGRKEREQEFKQLQELFIAMTSHELRTPVTVLTGYSDLIERILEKEPTSTLKTRLEQINQVMRKNLFRLTRSINSVHDTSRIRAGQFAVTLQPVPFSKFYKAVQKDVQFLYSDREISVTSSIKDPEKLSLLIDEESLMQVVHNLVSNAVKHSPESSVVEILFTLQEGGFNIAVRDSGCGIEQCDIPILFTPFFHRSSKYSSKGTGLGLFISKAIVDAHGGDITVHSELDVGSTFTVRIPQIIS
ncbi:MAG: ATP-binding protein [Candidatus Heimdallarchaeota archaeon]